MFHNLEATMERAEELITALETIADTLSEEDGRISRIQLSRVRALLPCDCNDEEIAALALLVLQTKRGTFVACGNELMTLLSRRAPGSPRWDIVLPRLAHKGLIALPELEGKIAERQAGPDMQHGILRDTQVALLLKGSNAEDTAGYSSNRRYLEDCFEYVDRMSREYHEQHPRGPGRRLVSDVLRSSKEVQALYDRIRRLSDNTRCTLPLEDLRREKQLSELDWRILVYALRKELSEEHAEVREYGLFFGQSMFDTLELRKYFEGNGALLRLDILSVRQQGRLLQCDVVMDTLVFNKLLENDACPETMLRDAPSSGCAPAAEAFSNNDEYLRSWLGFTASVIMEDMSPIPHSNRRGRTETNRSIVQHAEFQVLRRRSEVFPEVSPFEIMLRQNSFGDVERFILLSALLARLHDHPVDIPDVLKWICSDILETARLRTLFDADGPLVSKGLISVRHTMGTPDFIMPSRMVARFVEGKQPDASIHVLDDSSMFELRRPRHTLEAVMLPPPMHARLQTAVRGQCAEARERLRVWGVHTASGGRPPDSLLLLFSGSPGTGKTFAAEGLAGSLGRDLLVTDISTILSKWVGESEQNVSMLFSEYRSICASCASPPVLLLNECDQFLSHRIARGGRSVDRMYNQMQNLFLEHLESFPGILIATTNFTEALDEAFSRRFDEKIVFPKPDAALRLLLWQSHIPDGVPVSHDIDLAMLAGDWIFTGGQIAVAAANAIRSAAIRGTALCMADLLSACEHEARGSFENSAEQLGFRA
jgi:hypothetical protein